MEGWSEGDIEGYADATQNVEVNFNTLEGHIHAKQTLSDVTIEGKSGGFDGVYNSDCGLLTVCEGKFVAQGTGEFKGMKLFQTSFAVAGDQIEEYEGFILDPKGTLPDHLAHSLYISKAGSNGSAFTISAGCAFC